ncbi:hypothetical protein MUK42_14561 [Musa troglodytarum]|uniref:Uncharacterized protein n=1 Tax=Musa troglodytarum TaxID=320322 RepID=A0A9E7H5J3_9LILI|nr:hypothetical protein MUK42_14561 [Musa troglodytarum]
MPKNRAYGIRATLIGDPPKSYVAFSLNIDGGGVDAGLRQPSFKWGVVVLAVHANASPADIFVHASNAKILLQTFPLLLGTNRTTDIDISLFGSSDSGVSS